MVKKLYIILGYMLWTAAFGGLLVLLVSAAKQKQQQFCAGIDISISGAGGKIFVDEKAITKIILSGTKSGKLTKEHIHDLDLRRLESIIEKNAWISQCELYFDNNHVLHAFVEERTPVARIIEQRGASYYIDTARTRLPLSPNERADLPVFTNLPVRNKRNAALCNRLMLDVVRVASAIMKDSFWMKQAAQIQVSPTGTFDLYPAVGNHVVKLGTSEGIDLKLGRCKKFYTTVLSDLGLDAYAEINVAYQGQIVGQRAHNDVAAIDASRAMAAFDQMVQRNRQEAMDSSVGSKSGRGRMINTAAQPAAASPAVPEAQPKVNTNLGPPPVSATPLPKAIMPKTDSIN